MRNFEGGFARKDAAHGGERDRVETAARFFREFAVGHRRGTVRQAARALCIGNQFAQAEKNVLVASQSPNAGFLHHRGQRVQRQRRSVRSHLWMLRVQRFKFARIVVIVLPTRFQVELPAITADRHLHDLGGALINDGDANVAADLLHHVFVRVAVAAERLNTGFGSGIAGLGCHVFSNRPFGVEAAFVAGIDALRRLLYIGAGGLEAHGMRHDQLVRVALLFREWPSSLDALGGIRNGAIKRRPSRAQPKGRHHQPGVAEDRLRLEQSLAFDSAE